MKTKKAPSRLATAKPAAEAKIEAAKQEVANEARAEIVAMAAAQPHGQGKRLLQIAQNLLKIKDEKKLLGRRERGERAAIKEMKISLSAFDRAFKLSQMAVEDRRSHEAEVMLVKEQLGLELTEYEETIQEEVKRKREAARDAMIDASGGDAGEEVGSRTQYGASTDPEIVNTDDVPERNAGFTPPASAVAH